MFGTGDERLWGKNFYKRRELKITLLLIVSCRGGRAGKACRGRRDGVPLHAGPPGTALLSDSAPALLLGLTLDLEKLVSLVAQRSCHKLAFLFACFSFWQACGSTLCFLKKKKSLPGKQHRYKGSWTHQSNMQKGTEWASPTPHISVTRGGGGRLKPQPQGTENKPKTVLKRALPILCPHLSPSFSVRTMKHHLSIWRVKSTV